MRSSQSEPKNVLFGMRTGPFSLRPWDYLTATPPHPPLSPAILSTHLIHVSKGAYLVAARALVYIVHHLDICLQIPAVSSLSPQTRVRQDWM